jgi:hypothetical protein
MVDHGAAFEFLMWFNGFEDDTYKKFLFATIASNNKITVILEWCIGCQPLFRGMTVLCFKIANLLNPLTVMGNFSYPIYI